MSEESVRTCGSVWFLPLLLVVPAVYDIGAGVLRGEVDVLLSGLGLALWALALKLADVRVSIDRPFIACGKPSLFAGIFSAIGGVFLFLGIAMNHGVV